MFKFFKIFFTKVSSRFIEIAWPHCQKSLSHRSTLNNFMNVFKKDNIFRFTNP